MMKKVLPVFLGITLLGCLGPNLEERRKKAAEILDSWVGSNINDYMRSNGYATETRQLPNGNTLYVFQRSVTMQTPTYTTPITTTYTPNYNGGGTATTTGGNVYGGGQATYSCTRFFETDSDGRIVYWRTEGNCY